MAHSSSSLTMLLLAAPLPAPAAAPLTTETVLATEAGLALLVFVGAADFVDGAGVGADGSVDDGGTTTTGAAVVVAWAAAAIAEGDRHGDDAATGVVATAGFTTTGGDGTIGVDANGGVDDGVDDGTTGVIATGGVGFVAVVAVDGVIATGTTALKAERGVDEDDDDDDAADFPAAASLLLLLVPLVRPPLNDTTGGASLRRGVSSADGRVEAPEPLLSPSIPPPVTPPSPAFSISCARWSSSTCRSRSSGTGAGRAPVSVRQGERMRGAVRRAGEGNTRETEKRPKNDKCFVNCSPSRSSSSSISAISSSTD